MESQDTANPSHKTNAFPSLIWVSVLIGIITFKISKKVSPLILFSSLISSIPFWVDQLHTLDLVCVHLVSLWSHKSTTQIPQGLSRSHLFIRILKSRKPFVKSYPLNLDSSIHLSLPREPITLLFKQVSYIIESLLWIGSGNHPSSTHWSNHPCDSFIPILLPSVKVHKDKGALAELKASYHSIVAP